MYKTGLLAIATLLVSLTAAGAARAAPPDWLLCALIALPSIS